MISQLALIRQQLMEMAQRVLCDKTLPHPDYAVELNAEVNATRCALIALDTALHARHNERHPIKYRCQFCGTTDPQEHEHGCPLPDGSAANNTLDAATRADIDATP